MSEWNNNVMAEFRANQGKVGGVFESMPLLILHSKGVKSGNDHQTPLVYMEDNGNYVVFASQGGAPKHPAWYHNLVANPETRIEVGTETKEDTLPAIFSLPDADAFVNVKVTAADGDSWSGKVEVKAHKQTVVSLAPGAKAEKEGFGPGSTLNHRYGQGDGEIHLETFSGDAEVVLE